MVPLAITTTHHRRLATNFHPIYLMDFRVNFAASNYSRTRCPLDANKFAGHHHQIQPSGHFRPARSASRYRVTPDTYSEGSARQACARGPHPIMETITRSRAKQSYFGLTLANNRRPRSKLPQVINEEVYSLIANPNLVWHSEKVNAADRAHT